MQRKSKDEKAAILERYRNSGMSIKQFCSEAGLVEQNVRNWIKKAEFQFEQNQSFIEVVSNSAIKPFRNQTYDFKNLETKRAMKITFPQGISIEVYPDTDQAMLTWVLDLFQSRI